MHYLVIRFAVALAVLPVSLPAYAYVGPGAGLSVVGVLTALIGALLLMIAGFVWYPVKRLLKRKEKKESAVDASIEEDNARHSDLPPRPKHPQSERT